LVNAVQELKHQQDAKGTKIAALEVDNTKLKAASDELVDLNAENAKLAAGLEALEKAIVRFESGDAVRAVSFTQE